MMNVRAPCPRPCLEKGIATDESSSGPPFDEEAAAAKRFFMTMKVDEESSTASASNPTNSRSRSRNGCYLDRTAVFAILIALVGSGVACAFLALGLVGAHRDQDLQFTRKASEIVLAVKGSWDDYVGAALWIHEACRSNADQTGSIGSLKICTREDFAELYQYIMFDDRLSIQGMGFVPIVTRQERAVVEAEAFQYYQEKYPSIEYVGFTGEEPMPGSNETMLYLRSEQDFYVPCHYVEPVIPNKEFIGFDIASFTEKVQPEDFAMLLDWKPIVTERVDLAYELPQSTYELGYYVLLTHPGMKLPGNPDGPPDAYSEVFLKVNTIVQQALAHHHALDVDVYVFDVYKPSPERTGNNLFLGWGNCRQSAGAHPYGPGVDIRVPTENVMRHHYATHDVAQEPRLADLDEQKERCFRENVKIAQNTWTVVVCHNSGYEPDIFYIVLGSSVILLATLFLSLWFYSSQRRAAAIQRFQANAEAEKAALIIGNAKRTAAQERELNEYLSHEVRNPLAAAMSASSFVAAAIKQDNPLASDEAIQACRGDVHIIQSSLNFINDLLRSLLDMHKATSNKLRLQIRPTDVYSDVLEPVRTILDSKHNPFEFRIECPEHLVVRTDPLRLKQVVMNLSSNSRKFVTQGYIRIGAQQKPDGDVLLYVEDSGPGIPLEKRKKLFNRYQESLDSLNQGTGIGLSLSKQLLELLHGELFLEDNFDSGVPGCPGSRFVIDLKCKAEVVDDQVLASKANTTTNNASMNSSSNSLQSFSDELPTDFSVLIVDDDMILRRLVSRSIGRMAPTWKLSQAANGETALKMAAEQKFDLIFLDQYMASVEKQLLGTETAHAMRSAGVKSVICGLSANAIEDSFLKAGANAFIQKPFPCEKETLRKEIKRVLSAWPAETLEI